jgi:transcriptional regulator with XRE-family HTH domain
MENETTSAPVGARVRERVRQLRRERGLDLRGLSDRLAEEGRPISLGQLSKLELGQRRVDVDDLVALAVVLNVTPSQLLMPEPPEEGEDQVVALTPHRRAGWHRAWRWMCGDRWLDDATRPGKDADDLQAEAGAEAEWYYAARPHDPFGGYKFDPSFIHGREADVQAVAAAVAEAMRPKPGKNTLRREWLLAAIDFYLSVATGAPAPRRESSDG